MALAKEGFFNSLTMFSLIFFFVLIDVIYVNPFLILTVFLLAVMFNPAIYMFLWFIWELAGTLLGIAVGAPAGPSGMTLGMIIGAIGSFIGFLIVIFTRVLPFVLGIIYALVIVPQGLLLASWGIGIFFVGILFAYFLLYFLLFDNEIALYGLVASIIIAGLHTQSVMLVVGLAICALAGAIIGLNVPVNIKDLLNKAGILYYMAMCGIFMVGPSSEIVGALYSVLQLGFLAPATLVTLLFIMNIMDGRMEWNHLLFKLMAMAYILYCVGSAIIPGYHLPFTFWFTGGQPVIHPENYDNAIITYLNMISPAVASLYKAYARYLGFAIAFLVYYIYHPGTPEHGWIGGPAFKTVNLLDGYFLLVAMIIIGLAFAFDLITGLTEYSVFPLIQKTVGLPKKVEAVARRRKAEEKKKEKVEELKKRAGKLAGETKKRFEMAQKGGQLAGLSKFETMRQMAGIVKKEAEREWAEAKKEGEEEKKKKTKKTKKKKK